jgi:dTDP-4-dehydrorhamnose reductase
MRILVAGREGQVARALAARAGAAGLDLLAVGRPDLDLATGAGLDRAMAWRPDVVVNAAAYTAVDRAESEPEAAFAVNRDGAARLASAAEAAGVPFLHLSTDYVFDGTKATPYREDDPTAPLGVYGRSKYEGEAAVLAASSRAYVFRTAWVYGATGANFLLTMLRLAASRPGLRVVDDQTGNPTAADDIADALLQAARRLAGTGAVDGETGAPPPGVYHMTGAGETTWCGFARAIMAGAAERGLPSVAVEPIGTADYPTPARRPANSRLDNTKLRAAFGVQLPDWRLSMGRVLDAVAAAQAGAGPR